MLLALLLAAAPPFEAEVAAAIADTASVWPVPPALVRAVIRQESAGNPRAVSAVGARGLMQVMPETAAKVGVDEKRLFEPALNILAGVRLLAALLKHYEGDVVSALVAYNAGPHSPTAVPSNGETPEYVTRILAYWAEAEPAVATRPKKSQPPKAAAPQPSSASSPPRGAPVVRPRRPVP